MDDWGGGTVGRAGNEVGTGLNCTDPPSDADGEVGNFLTVSFATLEEDEPMTRSETIKRRVLVGRSGEQPT
jgi:hypothetical protein